MLIGVLIAKSGGIAMTANSIAGRARMRLAAAMNTATMMSETIPIISAMSRLWGVPYEPDDPHNKDNIDFQLGYCRGLQGDSDESCAGITAEWKRRGQPQTADDSFKDWKRGYWAGRFTRASRMTTEAITEEDIHETRQNGAGLGD